MHGVANRHSEAKRGARHPRPNNYKIFSGPYSHIGIGSMIKLEEIKIELPELGRQIFIIKEDEGFPVVETARCTSVDFLTDEVVVLCEESVVYRKAEPDLFYYKLGHNAFFDELSCAKELRRRVDSLTKHYSRCIRELQILEQSLKSMGL